MKEETYFAIHQNELNVLREFIGSLTLPWKQTNPYMQLLMALKEIKVQIPDSPQMAEAPSKTE